MVTNLKEAKARLSEFVEIAASGEEVLITVRGKAKARLCPVQVTTDEEDKDWGQHLEETRARYRVAKKTDNQSLWDELRGERQ